MDIRGAKRIETFGSATLILGDALAVVPFLPVVVDATMTDPPYSSGGQFRGDRMGATSAKYQGLADRGIYHEFSGDNRDQRGFQHWSALWLGACREVSREGAVCGLFTDWRQLPTTTDALQAGGYVWRGIAAWDKTEASRPMKGRYRNQCEYLVWGSNGPMSDDGPCAPGAFRYSVAGEEKHHIAGKPVALFRDLLAICGEVILDPFMGSGTTGIAALATGRKFFGVEIDESHFETACRRMQAALGEISQGDVRAGSVPEAMKAGEGLPLFT